MASIEANGITIEYEIQGSGPDLLLVMGLGGQLTDWPQELVDALSRHFRVIRFDNRDIGLSTHATQPPPERIDFVKALVRASWVEPAYHLSDMAADAAALLDALDIGSAHVVGMSMGGMIAQLLALDHAPKVDSLCSIMSTTGRRTVGQPSPRVWRQLVRRTDATRDEAVDLALAFFSRIGGRDWDADAQRARTEASLARSFNPAGVLRQSMAIATTPDRTERLAAVEAPTLVVHGLDDTLVHPSGGMATAEAIGHSRLMMFPRMGHDLPATRHAELVEAIRVNAARVPVIV